MFISTRKHIETRSNIKARAHTTFAFFRQVEEYQNTAEKGYGANGKGKNAELLRAWAKLYAVTLYPLHT